MKQVIGSPARKEQFFKRSDLRNEILDAITSGDSILVSAPRRVGKTSILLDLVDDPDPDVFTVYIDSEAIENPEDFFQLILKEILNGDRIEGFGKFSKSVKDSFSKWSNRLAGISIGGFGLDIRQGEKISYYDKLIDFLSEINLESKRIAILVDEFPITVEHIHHKHGIDGVRHFLNQNRTLRQNPAFQQKVKFIYCGSIGLFTVVKRLNATDRINDLREIKIGALRKRDAEIFVTDLLFGKTGMVPEIVIIDYILHKIEWWIPFYFQLMVKELSDLIVYDRQPWTEKTIDTAFEKVVENGNIYFQHFKSRLSKTFEKGEFDFVVEFLTVLKSRSTMEFNEVLNMAEGHNVRLQADTILEILIYDGYIIEEDRSYKFYSPILKRWWK